MGHCFHVYSNQDVYVHVGSLIVKGTVQNVLSVIIIISKLPLSNNLSVLS